MTTTIQRSFAGGEIAPSVYGRVDQAKYATGLRLCRNFWVMRHGGVANRSGTGFVAEAKYQDKAVRLIEFVFNAEQTYIIEMGDQYFRFHKLGSQLSEATKTITGATQADPCVISAAGHGYANGEEVQISGILGMTELNGRNFKVANVAAGTFELQTMDGVDLDATGYSAYVSGGTAARVYEIASPYLEADIFKVQFIQSADVITLVHPSYEPRELSRTGDTAWSLDTINLSPSIPAPDGGLATKGAAGSNVYKYQVTAIAEDTFEESLPGKEAAVAISGAAQANPVQITTSTHNYSTGDKVTITNVVGMTEINDREFTITVINGTQFTLDGEDGTGHTAYVSGGLSARSWLRVDAAAVPSVTNPHSIAIPVVAGAKEYNIYREDNGIFGFIGISGGTTFLDKGLVDPDTVDSPPSGRTPFNAVGKYPSAVNYFQQRLAFANTDLETEKLWASKIASFKNFSSSNPIQDDDPVTFSLAGRQVNEIRHILDLGGLVILTSAGEWVAQGGESGIITPTQINLKQQGYRGSSELSPLIIGSNALYVQARGSIVRDLGFDLQVDGYRGNDLTIFAAHLFDGFTLDDWAFQQIPHSIIWAVRNDGLLMGLTYINEHQVWGWHQHDFDGKAESVAAVPEGLEDAVYIVINRTIGGQTRRYIERLKTRRVDDIVDSVFMDASLTYDGRNANSGHTMVLSGGSTWSAYELLTLTSSTSFFTADDVGNAIHLTGSDGTLIRFSITSYTSGTVVQGKAHKTVPVAMRNAAISSWSRAVITVGGLWHLEGKAVSILCDGFVVANPNNSAYVQRTVSSGTVTLDKPFSVIHVGLPITSDLETLDIDTAQGETIVDRKKMIRELTIFVEESRGLWAGRKAPAADNLQTGLRELKIRAFEKMDDPVALKTGVVDVKIQSNWNSNGRIFIRQTDPLPLSVLAVAPAGIIPFRG